MMVCPCIALLQQNMGPIDKSFIAPQTLLALENLAKNIRHMGVITENCMGYIPDCMQFSV